MPLLDFYQTVYVYALLIFRHFGLFPEGKYA